MKIFELLGKLKKKNVVIFYILSGVSYLTKNEPNFDVFLSWIEMDSAITVKMSNEDHNFTEKGIVWRIFS